MSIRGYRGIGRRLIGALVIATALSGAAVTAGVAHDVAGGAQYAYAATTRATIAATANAEVGNSEDNGGCLKYGPCRTYEWCAMFAQWVWRTAGVSPTIDTWVATKVGTWGIERGLFKRRPAGQAGNPLPGDIVVYGEPGSGEGGHVSIVYSVNGDGTITTIDGNYSEAVARRTINPVTARAGARNVLISGYVTPPGVVDAPPIPSGPMYHQVRFADGSGWSGFQPLAGYGTAQQGRARDMAVAGMPDGSAQVLIIGADGGVYHEIRNANGTWTGLQPLPGMGTTATALGSRVAITGLPDGSAQVLIIGADGGVYHQIRNANGTWTGFQPLAGMGTPTMAHGSDVAIAGLEDGSAQVVIVGADGGVYHQIRNANGTWTGFLPRPGIGTTDTAKASRVAIAGLEDGSTQMLIVGADGGIYHQARYPYGHTQSDPDAPDVVRVCQVETGCWSGFAPVQGMGTTDTAHGSDVTIAGLPDESAQIAIVGADAGIYHETRDADGVWSGFQPLPGLGTPETARGTNVALAGLPDGSAQLTIVGPY
ncbi:CHAP domain-containing protein [Phytohabitans rumicis]|uniref:Peptidase C51 domain-containing protein n=1 Tax=Phytohabitans rumicis TaxID=1076125 RepID=A0A6V8L5R7_9ACTN|nr:CHAP domain-containing protein [Phytohabitans rumicis]GFJ92593.1 hypothetical protein Prum_062350 [Phytohabitans rumicis]